MKIITANELSSAAQQALENWDSDLMEPGQSDVLEAIANNPGNFSDNDGNVDLGKLDVWDYLEEVSSSLSA